MSNTIDEEMKARIAAARNASTSGKETSEQEFDDEKIRNVEELRTILKKFRRAMGSAGNPGTIEAQVLRSGWIVASGTVEGYGEEMFHIFLLTSGAVYYFSGDPTPPVEISGKWYLGDSIPSLEAKIPATVARIMAEHGLEWPETKTFY